VFITSANLTAAAFDRNIEAGLLVRDRALAASVTSHFRVLIERGLLSALPGGGEGWVDEPTRRSVREKWLRPQVAPGRSAVGMEGSCDGPDLVS